MPSRSRPRYHVSFSRKPDLSDLRTVASNVAFPYAARVAREVTGLRDTAFAAETGDPAGHVGFVKIAPSPRAPHAEIWQLQGRQARAFISLATGVAPPPETRMGDASPASHGPVSTWYPPSPVPRVPCHHCQTLFPPRWPWQKFCGQRCRTAYHNPRRHGAQPGV